jgi:hypothetical protein
MSTSGGGNARGRLYLEVDQISGAPEPCQVAAASRADSTELNRKAEGIVRPSPPASPAPRPPPDGWKMQHGW